jgi:hypothetical protein
MTDIGTNPLIIQELLDVIGADLKPPANDDAPIPLADGNIFIHPRAQHREPAALFKSNGGQVPDRDTDVDEQRFDGQLYIQDAEVVQVLEKTLANFLSHVVPWPQSDEQSYINVHWRPANRKGITGGRAFTELNKMVSFVGWAKRNPEIVWDLYFCTSLQAECGAECKSGLKAERSAADAIALKAIWADIDKYHGKKDGLEALRDFCNATRTPYPTAIIDSGNGYHVYWISDRPLSKAELQPYADGLDTLMTQHGLKHDAVTTDAARILRIPGTSNFKQNPPKPVVIKLLEADLSFASALGHLLEVKVGERAQRSDGGPSKVFHESGEQFESLKDGIEPLPSLPFKPIQEGCPFFADAYETHGKEHGQPLWHLAILATTFLENGEQLAHELGNAHLDYTRDTTQAMWDRKIRERKERGLGWPSCKAFEDAGCTSCKG